MTTTKLPAILVSGATGTIGSALAKLLAEKGIPFRALVRPTGATPHIPGAEVVEGDLNDQKSLKNALSGIERAFLLTNSSPEAESLQIAFVDAAKAAGVQHIVKLSQYAAHRDSPVRFLRYHAAVEEKILASGMAYTFLRPNLFMQGLLGFREPIIQQGKFFATIGEAPVSLVDIRDIAEVAAAALTNPVHENRIYTLTGPQAITHRQIAATLSAALGRDIQYIDVPPDAMHQALIAAGFPEWQAAGLIEDYAHYGRGEAAEVSGDIEAVTGRAARDFNRFVEDYAEAFLPEVLTKR